jgi:uncharacterized protein
MIIFLSIVLTLYVLSNLYLYYKGYRALSNTGFQLIYSVSFILLASTFVAGKFLENSSSNVLTDVLNIIGGFWLAFMLYGTLLWLTTDILLLAQKPFRLIPPEIMPMLKLRAFISITAFSSLLLFGGFINAVSPRVSRYNITLDKHFSNNSFRIVAVSDIHLGSIIRKRSMRHLSAMIKKEKPDIVLLLGDVIDGSIGPVIRGDLLSYLSLPELQLGVYAITGNHEYIGNPEKTIPYIESKGIPVLKDEVIKLGNGVQIAGRLDRSSVTGNGKGRQSLDTLLSGADITEPIIVLDHQPYGLKDLSKYSIDLQLSGHTHNGQMWPLNSITNAIFELSYGYKKFNSTHVIVSSGFGIWGPRVRIGTRPEILVIDIKSKL